MSADLHKTIFFSTPGLIGAAASSFFVKQSTWTTRAEAFLFSSALVYIPAFLFIYQISGPNGHKLSELPSDIAHWITA